MDMQRPVSLSTEDSMIFHILHVFVFQSAG